MINDGKYMTTKTFDELLQEEAPSNAGYMDIKEMMILYYGRLDMYASFSDDENFDMSGFEGSVLKRPYGVTAYTIDTIVGRKTFTSKFYAHVFRPKSRKGKFIKDIRDYTTEDFKRDADKLETFEYLTYDEVIWARAKVESNPRLRYPFHRLWNMTREIAKSEGKAGDRFWRRILIDLGYTGFEDYTGLGIMSIARQSVSLFLEPKTLEVYDIMPIQKYRKDKRQRIVDAINRKNKKMHTRRNLVAKRKTDPYRMDGILKIAQDIKNNWGRF